MRGLLAPADVGIFRSQSIHAENPPGSIARSFEEGNPIPKCNRGISCSPPESGWSFEGLATPGRDLSGHSRTATEGHHSATANENPASKTAYGKSPSGAYDFYQQKNRYIRWGSNDCLFGADQIVRGLGRPKTPAGSLKTALAFADRRYKLQQVQRCLRRCSGHRENFAPTTVAVLLRGEEGRNRQGALGSGDHIKMRRALGGASRSSPINCAAIREDVARKPSFSRSRGEKGFLFTGRG